MHSCDNFRALINSIRFLIDSAGAGIALWLERRTRDRTVAGSSPGRSGGSFFFFSTTRSTFCADSYFGIYFTPMLPQSYVKDPGHSAKSAGGRLQLNTHAPYICDFA